MTAMPTVGDSIVSARLLVVQSKRLMLSSMQRRFRLRGEVSLKKRTDRFQDEADRANRSYRSAVLNWGRATSPEFRLVAYGSLVDLAETLVAELRGTIGGLQPRDQFELATEVEVLERFIAQWRSGARPSAVAAVA
jgi:hypothetical protein